MAPSSEANTPEPLGLPVELDLDGVFRISTVGLLVWDRDGRLRHTNAAFVNMMQAPVTELIGRSWADFTPPEFWPASERALEQLKARGECDPYEKQYQRPDGSRWWGLFAARLVQAYWVEFVLDVTDRRHAELELAEVDRRKDVFLVTLGHELRNPLSALSNAIQIMRLHAKGDHRLDRTLEVMDRQVKQLTGLADDLLDVGRIKQDKLQLRMERLDFCDVLARGVEAARGLIDSRQHQLVIAPVPPGLLLDGDAVRLVQVVTNLLTNAARYTPPGGHIHIALTQEGDWAALRIEDDGIGMAEADIDSVFGLFSQLDKQSEEHAVQGGIGIGLALVRRIVELHGGDVRGESAGTGRGSAFTVRLPLPLPLPR